jgi:hypothetical protein
MCVCIPRAEEGKDSSMGFLAMDVNEFLEVLMEDDTGARVCV